MIFPGRGRASLGDFYWGLAVLSILDGLVYRRVNLVAVTAGPDGTQMLDTGAESRLHRRLGPQAES